MGDMNFHNQGENSFVEEFESRDLWAETHFSELDGFNDGNPGYTYDVKVQSIQNSLKQFGAIHS